MFSGSPQGLALCRAVEEMLAAPVRPVVRVTGPGGLPRGPSVRIRLVAGPVRPSGVPAVLSIALHTRIDSPRFKTVAHPSPGASMHRLELHSEDDLDAEVAGWLRQTRDEAG